MTTTYSREQVLNLTGLTPEALDEYVPLLDYEGSEYVTRHNATVEVTADGSFTQAGLDILQAQAAHDRKSAN